MNLTETTHICIQYTEIDKDYHYFFPKRKPTTQQHGAKLLAPWKIPEVNFLFMINALHTK